MSAMPDIDEQSFHASVAQELQPPSDNDQGSDQGRLKQLMSVLKKTIGVKDLASLRLSLPANLIHPEGNLEYWHYLDRPDLFAAIADSDDRLQRMLMVLRWILTKDLRQARGKVCKPYNSVLGERFRCIWDVEPVTLDPASQKPVFAYGLERASMDDYEQPSSSASSIKSLPSSPKVTPKSRFNRLSQPPSMTNLDTEPVLSESLKRSANSSSSSSSSSFTTPKMTSDDQIADTPATSIASGSARSRDSILPKSSSKARIVFLNEQVCHHPPISTFWYESQPANEGQRVQAYGVDQLSAKFTGTSVKVSAGSENFGIYVNLPDRNNEEYQISHPTASITGFLRGTPYVTISDYCYITCLSPNGSTKAGSKAFRVMINFVDESWIGKAKFALEGIVFSYELGAESAEWTKIKQVPEDRIVTWFEGNWRGKVTFRTTAKPTDKGVKSNVLIDSSEIVPLPKIVRPISLQSQLESRKLWQPVTDAIKAKQYSLATKHKQTIEQAQRDCKEERDKTGTQHHIELFDDAARKESGRPRLSEAGRQALAEDFKGAGYATDDVPTELLGSLHI